MRRWPLPAKRWPAASSYFSGDETSCAQPHESVSRIAPNGNQNAAEADVRTLAGRIFLHKSEFRNIS